MTRAPRVEIVLKVEFESVGQLRADFLSNLSTGGVFLRTPIPFAVGQVLQLALSLPGVIEPPATVEAEVRWIAHDRPDFARGVGVAFRGVAPELKQKLERLVSDNTGEAAKAPEPVGLRRVAVALLVANPILRDIIRGELERLARGGATHRAATLELASVPDLDSCALTLSQQAVDVVVADCDGLGLDCQRLVETLRNTGRTGKIPVIVLQGPAAAQTAPPNDARTIVLRKPVGMKSLYTTLLALASGKKAP